MKSFNLAYQLKITLKHSKPPIWRRIIVPANYTLVDLHLVIQTVMEQWDNSHLHEFEINKNYYGDPSMSDTTEFDEVKFPLNKVIHKEKDKFAYIYDFGDNWEHEVLVEKIITQERKQYPTCLVGKRACPPEDSGGIWGYEYKLEVIQNPKHPDYKDMLEWMGEDFDSEAFDINAVNEDLKKRF